MNKRLLQKLILIVVLGFVIYCPVFSQDDPEFPEILDKYIIIEESNKKYICTSYQDYLLIIDSKNITIYCHFNETLVLDSMNIRIIGAGNVTAWNSLVYCHMVGNKFTDQNGWVYIHCLPASVYVDITIDETPLGALGRISVFLYTSRNLSNVLVTLESSCTSMIKPYYTSSPSEFIGPNVLFSSLKEYQGILIKYYYVPQYGEDCTLSLIVKENIDQNLIQKVYKVNLTGESYTKYITVNIDETLNLFIIVLIVILLILIIL